MKPSPPVLIALLLTVPLAGCSGVDSPSPSTYGSGSPAATLTDEALAEQTGMTVEQIAAKRQMLTDKGIWPDEIGKMIMMGAESPEQLFVDEAEANAPAPEGIRDLVFESGAGEARTYPLRKLIGEKRLVLVFTRGYTGHGICPFCSTQTAQLAANKAEFEKRNARVMIIYPGDGEHFAEFIADVTQVDREKADVEAVGWPVVLDKDLQAVNLLGIAEDLAKPSVFIVDEQGNVVFTYVGANRTDRPSAKALLTQLDAL